MYQLVSIPAVFDLFGLSPSDVNIEAAPSLLPPKKYCDITGYMVWNGCW
jgi:hypothetical protein